MISESHGAEDVILLAAHLFRISSSRFLLQSSKIVAVARDGKPSKYLAVANAGLNIP
jgi:hypothetical protein